MDLIYEDKSVPNRFRGQWRSIEFECIFKDAKHEQGFIDFVKKNHYQNYVTLKDDCSIESDYDRGDDECHCRGCRNYDDCTRKYREPRTAEIVVSFRSGKDKIVRNICKFLRGKAYVNDSCGTHVHFDMRGIKLDTVKLYGERLAKAVPALWKILPRSRQNNDYCYMTINDIDDYERYAFVNMTAYKKHKTIEVRAHSGTIRANKILNWIKICETIMTTEPAINVSSINTTKALVTHYDFGKRITSYITKRANEISRRGHDEPRHEA